MRAKPARPQMGANPARVRADQERRRSGTAGYHAQGPSRKRTRAASRNAAINDQH